MRIDDLVFDDDWEDFPVVCDNGCPEGYIGRHKFSCEEAVNGNR